MRQPLDTEKRGELAGYYTLEAGAEALEITRLAVYEGIRRYRVPTIQVGKTLMFKLGDYIRAASQANKDRRG